MQTNPFSSAKTHTQSGDGDYYMPLDYSVIQLYDKFADDNYWLKGAEL